MEPSFRDRPDLSWVAEVLWGSDGPARVRDDERVPPGHRVLERYAVLPNARAPRMLVPLGNRRVAAAALRRFDAGMAGRARVARKAVAVGMATGVAQLVLRDRLVVTVPAESPASDLAGSAVTEHLRGALGGSDLHMAVYLGVPRPNRKPVLQVMTPDGELVAYAKVGWNDLTRGLVANEASVLRALSDDPPRGFVAPKVIVMGSLTGREALAMSPLPSTATGRGDEAPKFPMDATEEIANRGGAFEESLTGSAFWTALEARAGEAGARSAPQVRDRLDDLVGTLTAAGGDATLRFGSWHGDWTPWNMGRHRRDGRLFVWDWERSARPVPVGFDALHFHHQVLARTRGLQPSAEAVDAIRDSARNDLVALGVPVDVQRMVSTLYLLELFVRYDEASAGGGHTPDALHRSTLDAATNAAASL